MHAFRAENVIFSVCFGVCNRAAVVDGGDVRVSPHSRLRRQCGVIEVVTAPRLYRLVTYRHLVAEDFV